MNAFQTRAWFAPGMPSALVLLVLFSLGVVSVAIHGWKREQLALAGIMSAQGETLIRMVETGRRLGPGGEDGRPFRLNFLLRQMIRQGDVRFVAVLSPEGDVEAFSAAVPGSGLGIPKLKSLPAGPTTEWVLADSRIGPLFVVFRLSRTPRRSSMMPPDSDAPAPAPRLIAVGFDATPYQHAQRKDIFTMAVSGGLVLTLAAAAGGTIFWRRKVLALEQEVARQERLAAMGTLAAGVAHEIRNPLSSIKGFATYFGSRLDAGSADRELAEVMIGEVDRLNRVVSELLELTHPSELRPSLEQAADLCRHALRLVEGECLGQGISVRTECDDCVVRVDRDRILQALLNLLLNAVQAMPDGGVLTVGVQSGKDRVTFTVSDTGAGIDQEELTRIFDPYYTTRNKGTGLGLSMVRKIVEAHHGRVQVASERGVGTTMILELPVWKDGI